MKTPLTDALHTYVLAGTMDVVSLESARSVERKLREENARLQAWKDSALAVESEWDSQGTATLLGAPVGVSCRKFIGEKVPALIAERDQLRAELEKWKAGCLANADDAKDCHRRADEQRLEILSLKAEVERLKHIPDGSPFKDDFESDCAFTYADWIKNRQQYIDRAEALSAEVEALRAMLPENTEFKCTGCGGVGYWDEWASLLSPGKHQCDGCFQDGKTDARLVPTRKDQP